MNVRCLMMWALVCGAGGTVGAEEVGEPGVPPQWAVVKEANAEAKTVQLVMTVSKPVYETYEYKVETPDGRVETRTATRARLVSEVRIQVVSLVETRVVTAGKEKLDDAAAFKRLTANTPVLLLQSGQKLDARYASLLKDDALILIAPDPAKAPLPGGARIVPVPNPLPPDAPKK